MFWQPFLGIYLFNNYLEWILTMAHTVTFPLRLVTFPGYVSFQWAMTMWIQLAISHDARVGIEEMHRQQSGGQAQQDHVSFKPYSAAGAFPLPSVLWCSFCSQSESLESHWSTVGRSHPIAWLRLLHGSGGISLPQMLWFKQRSQPDESGE